MTSCPSGPPARATESHQRSDATTGRTELSVDGLRTYSNWLIDTDVGLGEVAEVDFHYRSGKKRMVRLNSI